jgi:hypothetical protein
LTPLTITGIYLLQECTIIIIFDAPASDGR